MSGDPELERAFLLKEYDRVHQLWMDENTQVERRVGFFLTFAPAALGAVSLAANANRVAAPWFLFVACLALLAFGWVILSRVIHRICQVLAYRQSLQFIRNAIFGRCPELTPYRTDMDGFWKGLPSYRWWHTWNSGSLTCLVSITNGLLAAGAAAALMSAFEAPIPCTYLAAAVSFAAMVGAQIRYELWAKTKTVPWKHFG